MDGTNRKKEETKNGGGELYSKGKQGDEVGLAKEKA